MSPLVTVAVLGGFVIYEDLGGVREQELLRRPVPVAVLLALPGRQLRGATWAIVGSWWPLSPALLVLPFPLGFRLTCYYYRKAYYRSFWWAPPACAVPDARPRYTGETRFPLILQNIHRYFFYLACRSR